MKCVRNLFLILLAGLIYAQAASAVIDKVNADLEVNKNESIVGYDIKTIEGKVIRIEADYTNGKPGAEITNVSIIPPPDFKNGVNIYKIISKEGREILVKFICKKNKVDKITMHTDPPSYLTSGDKEMKDTISVSSVGGFLLDFEFGWKGKTKKYIRIIPRTNAYGEAK